MVESNESKRKFGKDFCMSDPRLVKENAEYLEYCKKQHPIYIIVKGKRIMGTPDIVHLGEDPMRMNLKCCGFRHIRRIRASITR